MSALATVSYQARSVTAWTVSLDQAALKTIGTKILRQGGGLNRSPLPEENQ
ncbi:hypothetical protein [Streptomyces sp. NPDC002599]|uniref:hypothetical protein n=1 Tax=Streptomyces sp. NPDC002599 TaxID=3154421 RepID=UPI00331D9AD3